MTHRIPPAPEERSEERSEERPDEYLDDLLTIDRYAVQFEKALKTDTPQAIEDVLDEAPENVRQALFSELLALELTHLRHGHRPPSRQHYLARFPHHSTLIDETYAELGISDTNTNTGQQLVDGYRVQRQIARGGMGVVYEALDQQLGRVVALKMLTANSLSGEQLARFQAESRVLAKLDHPHVLRIHAIGHWHDQPYLVLEYAAGGTLADRLKAGPLSTRDTLQLMATLVRTVAFLHDSTLVHRDLKPSNILFSGTRELKIGDFGLVRDLLDDTALTHADTPVGTPAYMAPEQLNADRGEVSPATDIYTLGVIMHQMLTGQVPYQTLSASEMVSALSSEQPVPIERLQAAGVPKAFARVCQRCLQKKPAHRYPSAAALLADIERLQQGLRISVLPLYWQRALDRSRSLAAGVALLALGAVLAGSLRAPDVEPLPGFLFSEVLDTLPASLISEFRAQAQSAATPTVLTLLGADQSRSSLSLDAPLALAIHEDRYLAIADSLNHRVLVLDLQTGDVSRLAGNGGASYAGDGGPAVMSALNVPSALTFDEAGNLYIVDRRNHAVRVVDSSGTIRTLTGVDGCLDTIEPSSRPYLCHPTDMQVLSNGDYFVADGFNQRIRYQQQGAVLTTALTRVGDDFGDTGRPFGLFPRAITFAEGQLYFLDATAGTLGRLDERGGVETLASGFHHPTALVADSYGHVYVSDASNLPITRVHIETGETRALSRSALFGDSHSDTGQSGVDALAVDRRGRVYFSSRGDNSVRVVMPTEHWHTVTFTGAGNRQAPPMVAADPTDTVVQRLERHETFSYIDVNRKLLLTDLASRLGLELFVDDRFSLDDPISLTHYPLTGYNMLAVTCLFIQASCGLEGQRLIVADPERFRALTQARPLRLPGAETLVGNVDRMPAHWRDDLQQQMDFAYYSGATFGEFLQFVESQSSLRFELDASATGFRDASYQLDGSYRLGDLLVPMMLANDMTFSFDDNVERVLVGYQPSGE